MRGGSGELEQRRELVFGVNECATGGSEMTIPRLNIWKQDHAEQMSPMAAMRAKRNHSLADWGLSGLHAPERSDANLMPLILDCARVCTLYEITAPLEDGFGVYREPEIFQNHRLSRSPAPGLSAAACHKALSKLRGTTSSSSHAAEGYAPYSTCGTHTDYCVTGAVRSRFAALELVR